MAREPVGLAHRVSEDAVMSDAARIAHEDRVAAAGDPPWEIAP